MTDQGSITDSTVRRFRFGYRTALLIVAGLTVASQVYVQLEIVDQRHDAPIINMAGRQRMLSQTIAKRSLLLTSCSPGDQADRIRELQSAMDIWTESQNKLRYGSDTLPPASESVEIQQAFEEIQPYLDAAVAAGHHLIVAVQQGESSDPYLQEVLENEKQFLPRMQAIVRMLDLEAQAGVGQLQRIELTLMGLVLVALVLECLFVFEPLLQRMDGQIQKSIRDAEKIARAQEAEKHIQALEAEIESHRVTGEKLVSAKLAAEQASRTKSEFLANMSHEIRTPLNGILGFAERLKRPDLSVEVRQDHLNTIQSSGEHLLELINNILDLSRVEAGQLPLLIRPCCPRQVIQEAASMLRLRAEEKHLRLDITFETNVPQLIETDAGRFRQILTNVIGNAIKFTEFGKITVDARSVAVDGQSMLQVTVVDTGVGIVPEQLSTIFDSFEQADTSVTRGYGGTGLGLTMSHQLLNSLGGELSVESELGIGSEFRIRLPANCPEGRSAATDPSSQENASRLCDSESLKVDLAGVDVLVCEDGETNRRLIGLLLEDANASVQFAENGKEGVELAGRYEFDLILMDMQMPVLDGYRATETLRQLGCTVPVLALTAHAMVGDKEKCLKAGCSGYLTKPIQRNSLLQTVAESLDLAVDRQPSEKAPLPTVTAIEEQSASADEGMITSTLPVEDPSFREIVELFVDKLGLALDEMSRSCESEDFEELAQAAHWLKGTGGTVGFDCLTEPAATLERAARESNPQQARQQLRRLRKFAARLSVPTGAIDATSALA